MNDLFETIAQATKPTNTIKLQLIKYYSKRVRFWSMILESAQTRSDEMWNDHIKYESTDLGVFFPISRDWYKKRAIKNDEIVKFALKRLNQASFDLHDLMIKTK